MSEQVQATKVLITVMTYPHPSRGYQEIVCTAGVTEEGEWIRLYPIDYRYRPRQQQFRKYQWLSIDLLPYGHGNDRRKESRKPLLDTMKVLGPPLDTKNKWAERRAIIDRMPVYTVNQLKALHDQDRTSLGIVRLRSTRSSSSPTCSSSSSLMRPSSAASAWPGCASRALRRVFQIRCAGTPGTSTRLATCSSMCVM